ncbi:PREDICTED: uncharacterized protein LOC106815057 [Priapulus caudatus]|uniref:Uncharacterized protein LOC106815057 n=1 Tax=Priapulus caudatus TaxID=37621 RepID=A0ABM1ES00_PRICU|nr:PREDICTED: uncharacterized protein LOC106815057 [Priapulus caudatus]
MNEWSQWLIYIQKLEQVYVPRSLRPRAFTKIVSRELHAFADASDIGYGIAVYTRLQDDKGQVCCSLLFGRSRVAPLKKVTTPRMELTAASVAVKIVAIITGAMEYEFDKIVYWTDSMFVLRYITNQTSRFHTFVANRVTCHRLTLNQWRCVPTQHNPADSASRGLRPKDQRSSEQWLLGPKYVWEPESQWPSSEFSKELSPEDPEVKKVYATLAAPGDTVTTDKLFARYSN